MVKVALVAALFFGSVSAQARIVEIKCKANPNATVSQFVASATFNVDDADNLVGTVQFATRSSQSAQTSEIRTSRVKGRILMIPANDIMTYGIESFQVADESNQLIRMMLNPEMSGPHSSTLVINRKDRYSSECKMVSKSSSDSVVHD